MATKCFAFACVCSGCLCVQVYLLNHLYMCSCNPNTQVYYVTYIQVHYVDYRINCVDHVTMQKYYVDHVTMYMSDVH